MSADRTARSRLRSFWYDLRRTVRARRRPLAALCAAVAVAAGLQVVRPPGPETEQLLVAAHDLAAGTTLERDDLTVVDVPPDAVPEHAYDEASDAAGETVASPMRTGESVTDRRLVQPGLLDGYPSGSVLSSVRLVDAATLTGLRVGDRVDVIAVDPRAKAEPSVVADGARVVSLPEPDAERAETAVIMLAVPRDVALALADAAAQTRLSVVSVQ